MIRSFAFRGQRILLLPSPMLQAEKPLFAGDSMTLLVGPNGSGKTGALASLASIFSKSKSNAQKASDIDWHDDKDKATTCGIYCTTTPFEVAVPESNDRYRKIQPEKKSPVRDEAIGKELKAEFGLDVRRELRLSWWSSTVFTQLLFLVISKKDVKRKNFLVSDPWVQDFRLRYTKHKERRYGPGTGSAFSKSVDEEWNAIRSDFEIAVHTHLGPGFLIKFHAFLHAQKEHRMTNKAIDQLLAHLGFSITKKVDQVAGPASKSFIQALGTLQGVANILGVADLTKTVYLVDDAQAVALDDLPLGSLGKVLLVGLSSGAAALIDQFTNIESESRRLAQAEANEHLLLLIDEGDAFLHLQWQQRYVDYLDKTVARLKKRFKSVQVVLTTHSPVIMSDFPRDCITILDHRNWAVDAFTERAPVTPDISFGAPLDAVIRNVGGAGSLGSFSAKVMRELVDDIASGVSVEQARIDMIDDLVIRQQIQRMLAERLPASRT